MIPDLETRWLCAEAARLAARDAYTRCSTWRRIRRRRLHTELVAATARAIAVETTYLASLEPAERRRFTEILAAARRPGRLA